MIATTPLEMLIVQPEIANLDCPLPVSLGRFNGVPLEWSSSNMRVTVGILFIISYILSRSRVMTRGIFTPPPFPLAT